MNHEWQKDDSCSNCKLRRSKTPGGTAKYTDSNGKTRWTPGPCAPLARPDPTGDAEPKTILTAPVQGKNGPTSWAGPATAHVDTETGKRTELMPSRKPKELLAECSKCGTKARIGQDVSDWTKDNVCLDCQEPEKAAARTIRVRLVPVTRTDLMCLVCGMFRTELGVAHGGEGDMQIGVHKRCVDEAHSKRGS